MGLGNMARETIFSKGWPRTRCSKAIRNPHAHDLRQAKTSETSNWSHELRDTGQKDNEVGGWLRSHSTSS